MKKRTIYLASIFLLIACISKAQQKVIDSLEQQLINPTNGLSKVENLNWLGYYYARTDPEKGLNKLDKSIELAIRNNDSLQLGKAYEYKGLNHKNLGNDSLMLSFFNKAEYIYKNIDSKGALPFLILNRGIFYQQRSNYHKAIEDCQKALEIFTLDKDTLLMGYTLGRLGFNNIYLGDYTNSLKAFQKGASLLEKINKEESMHYGSIQGDMGLLYQKLSEYETALKYHNKCLEIYKKYDFQKGISNQYNDIGNIYTKLGEYEKALDIYKSSYNMKKKTKNKADIASGLANIGITYSHLNQFDKAIIYLDSSMIISRKLKDNSALSVLYDNLGDIYLEKKEILKARRQYDSAVFYARKADDKRAIYLGNLGLAEASFKQANYKTAYKSLKEATTIKDSLLTDKKRNELANLKAKYEYEKEKAILESNFEKEKALDEAITKQKVLIRNFSIGAVIFIGFFIFYFLKQRHKKEKLKEIYTTETRISQKVHDELANDVYSVMNRIQNNDVIKQNDVLDQLENIYKKTRDISYENGTINLEDKYYTSELKDMLQSYQNETTRISIIGFKQDTFKNVANHKKIIIERILKELMTNMKKHSKATDVVLTFNKDKQNIKITYTDNGVGIKNATHFKRNGLQNAENRIKTINGSFNFDTTKANGININISIPV